MAGNHDVRLAGDSSRMLLDRIVTSKPRNSYLLQES